MMFAILFGLSMDYEVFILSRIREEYPAPARPEQQRAHRALGSARVITAAALIMISVFGAFVLGDDPIIKMFGVGLSAAVLLDATIVRMVIVPAVMALFDDRGLVAAPLARPAPPQPRRRGRAAHDRPGGRRAGPRARRGARADGRVRSCSWDGPLSLRSQGPVTRWRSPCRGTRRSVPGLGPPGRDVFARPAVDGRVAPSGVAATKPCAPRRRRRRCASAGRCGTWLRAAGRWIQPSAPCTWMARSMTLWSTWAPQNLSWAISTRVFDAPWVSHEPRACAAPAGAAARISGATRRSCPGSSASRRAAGPWSCG